mmetsp:Transcript_2886/g.6209  ORF Transcript_2886/g.6209 Transcript_2886/m.6209 type:complete len:120 (-) Transcript_2886:691-1050(-)
MVRAFRKGCWMGSSSMEREFCETPPVCKFWAGEFYNCIHLFYFICKHMYSISNNCCSTMQLELWSDWYTIYKAEQVYHTASGFSESATHASGAIDRMILGNNNSDGSLLLKRNINERDH